DLDRVTWGGRAKGVGTVQVRWDVRECSVGVMGKRAGKIVGRRLGFVMGLGNWQKEPLGFVKFVI
nr:hypothetical protein [Tanacetum cinerariifolium]